MRVQLVGLKVPVEFEVKLTVPVGVDPIPGEESITVAVHVLAVLTVTEEGEQAREVLVALSVTVRPNVPKLVACVESPLYVPVML